MGTALGLAGYSNNKNSARLQQGDPGRHMHAQRSGGMERNTDRAMVRSTLVEQRMQMAHGQEHRY